jgi:transposase, IS30 family
LCRRIEAWMDDGWSPGLIARVLKADSGSHRMGRVSHEGVSDLLCKRSVGLKGTRWTL